MSRCVINVPSCQSAARPSLSAQMKQSDFPPPARSTLITKLRTCGRVGALRPRHCQGETRHSGNSERKDGGRSSCSFLKYLTCTVCFCFFLLLCRKYFKETRFTSACFSFIKPSDVHKHGGGGKNVATILSRAICCFNSEKYHLKIN